MRVLIAEIAHESNCFASPATSRAAFEAGELLFGEALVTGHCTKGTVLGGMLRGLAAVGATPVPVLAASAVPSGPVEGAFFKDLCDRLIAATNEVPDAILLSLHGGLAIADDGVFGQDWRDDPEGCLVAAVRAQVGADVPIVVVFDLHSDTSDLLLASADLTLAFNEEPHRDAAERGEEAALRLDDIASGRIRPVQARCRVAMLLPAIAMATDDGPMARLHDLRREMETRLGVIDVSIHAGFYGSDQPEAGFSVVCTTDGDGALARATARELAHAANGMRDDFYVALVAPVEALAYALESSHPVALIDEADDPAGGGACDGVEILRAMVKGGIARGGVSTVCDPVSVAAMAAAGEGAEVALMLGARTDNRHGEPLAISGRVVRISHDPVPKDNWSGRVSDAGLVGVLDAGGILVVITQRRLVSENIDIFAHLGFDVMSMQAVLFKGLTLHVRQALAGKIETFLSIDGFGVTHPDVTRLGGFRRLKRPCWPFEAVLEPLSLP